MTIYEKLAAIQMELKAPKNLYNNFGKYNYRNAESILEAFKPLAAKYRVTMLIFDKMEQIGDRYYIKAIVILQDLETNNSVEVYAYAREADSQRGMDAAQITGCTSSYARKYALNGLFLIDDTKDPDTDEFREEKTNRAQARERAANEFKLNDDMKKTLIMLAEQAGYTEKIFDFTKEWTKEAFDNSVNQLKAKICSNGKQS